MPGIVERWIGKSLGVGKIDFSGTAVEIDVWCALLHLLATILGKHLFSLIANFRLHPRIVVQFVFARFNGQRLVDKNVVNQLRKPLTIQQEFIVVALGNAGKFCLKVLIGDRGALIGCKDLVRRQGRCGLRV